MISLLSKFRRPAAQTTGLLGINSDKGISRRRRIIQHKPALDSSLGAASCGARPTEKSQPGMEPRKELGFAHPPYPCLPVVETAVEIRHSISADTFMVGLCPRVLH